MDKKLLRYAALGSMKNVTEYSHSDIMHKPATLRGNWNMTIFRNNNPIVLELGCGRGEYTVALAKLNPDKNFIGIDIKGNRLWCGAKKCLDDSIANAHFIRGRIDFIENIFTCNELSEIWITFADPQPRKGDINKRLTAPRFMDKYKLLLTENGCINLKTDSTLLYAYTIEIIEELKMYVHFISDDVNKDLDTFPQVIKDVLSIQTYYESKWRKKGNNIHFIQTSFRT